MAHNPKPVRKAAGNRPVWIVTWMGTMIVAQHGGVARTACVKDAQFRFVRSAMRKARALEGCGKDADLARYDKRGFTFYPWREEARRDLRFKNERRYLYL